MSKTKLGPTNLFQSINQGAFVSTTIALVQGTKDSYAGASGNWQSFLHNNHELIAFSLFYIFLRVKITFDDHKHFAEAVDDPHERRFRDVGYFLAILAFAVWALSGVVAKDVKFAAGVLGVSLLISTMWIFIHVARILTSSATGHEAKRQETIRALRLKWIYINIAYIALLWLYSNEIWKSSFDAECYIWACLVVMFYDYLESKPFTGIIEGENY